MNAKPPAWGARGEAAGSAWVTTLLLLALAVLTVQLQKALTNCLPETYPFFSQYLNLKLPLIFKGRVLMRVLIRALSALGLFGGDPARVNTLLQILFLWAALCLILRIARRFVAHSATACVAPVLACAFLPWGFLEVGFNFSFPYDLPTVFYCALGILFLLRRQFWPFLAAVVVGTLNKETMLWLVAAYVFQTLLDREPGVRPWLRMILLGGVFAACYFGPRALLATSADHAVFTVSSRVDQVMKNGTITHTRLQSNLQELRLNFRGTIYQNVYWAFLLHLPALIGWRRLPRQLRLLYAGVPFLLVPLFLFTNICELRLYNEIIPLGAVAATCVLGNFQQAEKLNAGQSLGTAGS